MNKNIETDIKNAYDDMSLQELTEYMEHINMPSVSDESKARIKALVAQKLDTENISTKEKQTTSTKSQGKTTDYQSKTIKNGKSKLSKRRRNTGVFRFATVAAAFVLVITGMFVLNTDSVKASLAKMFGFIPGVGVVEVPSEDTSNNPQSTEETSINGTDNNQSTGWYILKDATYRASDENIVVEIQNANIVDDVLTVNYTVDLLNISVSDLEELSLNLSEDSFKDYADLYTNAGYASYFEIKASADTLTPLSSVELEGNTLSLLDREVLSGEALEGAKFICISESYKVNASAIQAAPAGSLTVGGLKVDFAMRDLQAYILDESAEQNGAICTVNGIKLLCVPSWDGEIIYLDFYTMETGDYDRLLGFGMGYWPEVTVNNQSVEGFVDESYVFETEDTGCLGRRIYYDLSGVEGEITNVEVYLEGVMAVKDEEVAVLDATKLDMTEEGVIHFSQTVNMSQTSVEFTGLTKYKDEDEFLYSEHGNVLVNYNATDSYGDAEFAGFDRITINGIDHDIWAEGDGELYLKLPCELNEVKAIECKGIQYFVYSGFTFTIEK